MIDIKLLDELRTQRYPLQQMDTHMEGWMGADTNMGNA